MLDQVHAVSFSWPTRPVSMALGFVQPLALSRFGPSPLIA